jgi:Myb-like DNA-binding domain
LTKHAFKVIRAAAPSRQAPVLSKSTKTKTKDRREGKKESGTTDKKKDRSNSKKGSNGKKKKKKKESSSGKNPVILTSQRNKQILDAIKKHGTEDWELIASEVPGWTAEDCRRRWELFLDPSLSSRYPFSEDEIRDLLSFQSKEGNDWTTLAPRLNRRSPVHISDRWNRKFRSTVVSHLQNLGFTLDEIEGDEKKRINYRGHFEEVVEAVMATIKSKT